MSSSAAWFIELPTLRWSLFPVASPLRAFESFPHRARASTGIRIHHSKLCTHSLPHRLQILLHDTKSLVSSGPIRFQPGSLQTCECMKLHRLLCLQGRWMRDCTCILFLYPPLLSPQAGQPRLSLLCTALHCSHQATSGC